jgi:uncharacterized surface protein with fasciclin (FAS1) repeats
MQLRTCLLAGAFALVASAVALTPAAAQCDATNTAMANAGDSKGSDIVATATAAGDFKTLVAAVQAAGLVSALQGEGPFTVFAPNDAAFAKRPKGTLDELLKPENKAKLASILTYHVVAGKVMAKDAAKLTGATTLGGQRIDISATDGGVMIDGAKVLKTDIACSNGVIHVIDSVILPADKDIVATAKGAGTFETLLAAATAAGLVPALTGEGPLTVFAPTDEAFAKLPKGTVENLLKPENKEQLAKILKFHVVTGRVYGSDAAKAGKAATLAGPELRFEEKDGGLVVGTAKVVAANIDAKNGVIHVIDAVLLPE